MTEKEMAELGAVTLQAFFNRFGEPSQYKSLIMEVLLEELMNAKVISILSQQEQNGDQIGSDPTGVVTSVIETNGPDQVGPAAGMAEQDSQDSSGQSLPV